MASVFPRAPSGRRERAPQSAQEVHRPEAAEGVAAPAGAERASVAGAAGGREEARAAAGAAEGEAAAGTDHRRVCEEGRERRNKQDEGDPEKRREDPSDGEGGTERDEARRPDRGETHEGGSEEGRGAAVGRGSEESVDPADPSDLSDLSECLERVEGALALLAGVLPEKKPEVGKTRKRPRGRGEGGKHLDPTISRAPWSQEEDRVVLRSWMDGTGWVDTAKLLPGRSDNAIRNRWYSVIRARVEKHLHGKNIDGLHRVKDAETGRLLIGNDFEGCLRAARAVSAPRTLRAQKNKQRHKSGRHFQDTLDRDSSGKEPDGNGINNDLAALVRTNNSSLTLKACSLTKRGLLVESPAADLAAPNPAAPNQACEKKRYALIAQNLEIGAQGSAIGHCNYYNNLNDSPGRRARLEAKGHAMAEGWLMEEGEGADRELHGRGDGSNKVQRGRASTARKPSPKSDAAAKEVPAADRQRILDAAEESIFKLGVALEGLPAADRWKIMYAATVDTSNRELRRIVKEPQGPEYEFHI